MLLSCSSKSRSRFSGQSIPINYNIPRGKIIGIFIGFFFIIHALLWWSGAVIIYVANIKYSDFTFNSYLKLSSQRKNRDGYSRSVKIITNKISRFVIFDVIWVQTPSKQTLEYTELPRRLALFSPCVEIPWVFFSQRGQRPV